MGLKVDLCVISIVIPCYNVETYITQCIESVTKQTYSFLEIICVNDGSTDSTAQILNQYSQKDNRIKVVNQENMGLSDARNTGIKHSTGDLILFIDSDDWIENNAVEILLENKHVDLICFSYNRIFENKVQPRKLTLAGEFEALFLQRRIVGLLGTELADPSQADSLVTAWGKLYNSKIIRQNKIQFIDTKMIGTEDALFNIQYLEFAKSVRIIDRPLYNYRKTNSSSLTNIYKPELFEKWKVLYSRIAEIIQGKNENFSDALQNRISLSIIGLGLNETFSRKSNAQKRTRLKEILSDPLFENAYVHLELKYFPLHWRLFFHLAKYKNVHLLLMMLQTMNAMINRKN